MLGLSAAIWDHHHRQREATRGTAYLSTDIRPGDAGCVCSASKSRPNASEEPPEHNPMQVLVRDNNIDQALRVLKKKMQREGVFREMKRRRFYEKPSEKSNRNKLKQSAAPASSLARRPNARDLSPHHAQRRCYGADRLGVAHSRARAEFRLNGEAICISRDRWQGTSDETLRWSVSLLVAQSPKLKAFRIDCFLDRVARQVVGRSIVRRYGPGSSPGAVLVRKFVHIGVACKGAQPVRGLRFENVNAHGAPWLKLPNAARFKGQQYPNRSPAPRQIDGAKYEPRLNCPIRHLDGKS